MIVNVPFWDLVGLVLIGLFALACALVFLVLLPGIVASWLRDRRRGRK